MRANSRRGLGFRRRIAHAGNDAPLFQRVLGDAWRHVPETVRALHAERGRHCWEGRASVERGRGFLARLCAAAMGFPRAAASMPVRVEIAPHGRGMRWRRIFDAQSFASVLTQGTGPFERLVVERFGPLAFGIALVREGARLSYVVRRWSLFGIPMPSRWAPGGATQEFDDGGRFGFDVEIRHRLTGLIVRYKGWLIRAAGREEAQP